MSQEINLGPRDDGGIDITVVRGFEDGTEEYVSKSITYRFHGVDSVDVQDPWEIGGGKCGLVKVKFVNGEQINVDGVVTFVDP